MIGKIEILDKSNSESMQVFYISKKNCKAFFQMYCDELREMRKNKNIFYLSINEENLIATWYAKDKEWNYKFSISESIPEFDVFWQLENRDTMNEMLKKFPELSEDIKFENNI